jgi:hypothetical protein
VDLLRSAVGVQNPESKEFSRQGVSERCAPTLSRSVKSQRKVSSR